MLNTKKGLIFDIDGTLTFDNRPLPGAADVIQTLRQRQITLRFATNGTGKSPEQLAEHLTALGIGVAANEVETSVTACLRLLASRFQGQRGRFLLPKRTEQQFTGHENTTEQPDYIVLGDIEEAFNYQLMNELFQQIQAGAQLIVFHKNLYYRYAGETRLDTGAYTLALEQATQKPAIVTGKPSEIFYQEITQGMNLSVAETVIVGDDLSTDIWGANQVGMDSVLAKTGKYAAGLRHEQAIPTQTIASIANLLDLE